MGVVCVQLTSGTTNRGGESYWFAIPNVGHVAKFLVRSCRHVPGVRLAASLMRWLRD